MAEYKERTSTAGQEKKKSTGDKFLQPGRLPTAKPTGERFSESDKAEIKFRHDKAVEAAKRAGPAGSNIYREVYKQARKTYQSLNDDDL